MIVYTAIFGGYDRLQPLPPLPDGWAAYCFTDDSTLQADGWQIVLTPNSPLIHRKIKILPHLYFAGKRTLWIDGNLKYTGDWTEFADLHGYWVMHHPERMTVEQEIHACIRLRKDTPRLLEHLAEFGRNYVVATGVMVRDDHEWIREMNLKWWELVQRVSHRDQITFTTAVDRYDFMPFLRGFVKNKHLKKFAK